MYHEYFAQELLQLQEELFYHPEICSTINPEDDVPTKLGKIAAKLNIILDGDYLVTDVAEMLTKKLYEKRTSIILAVH